MAVQFGDVTFDESRRQLYRGEQLLHVSPKAFQLLGILITEKPRALSKEELQQRLWPDTFVTEGNLASLIAELRSALGDEARKPRYIRTHHGFGYSFVSEVVETERPDAAAARAITSGRRTRWTALAIGLLLVLSVGFVWISNRSRAEAKAPAAAAPIRSIAVLPFDTMGIGEADAHLGLGLADLIITRLSNVDALTVRPTSAVRGFSRGDFNSSEAGRKLNVDGVLEGSIRTAGDRVRVTVQLFDVKKSKPIWADQFDETRAEMFTIEDRISARVADAILVRLSPDEKTRLAKRYTASPEAYQLYIQGRYHLQKGAGGPPDAAWNATKFFTDAIEKDPNYALAWAALARAHAGLAGGGRADPTEHYVKAEQAALRAREIDPQLYEPLVTLAFLRMYWRHDYAGAEREFQRALAIRPRDADTISAYGYLLQSLGRFDEAAANRQRLIEIEPLNTRSHWAMANVYLTARRWDLGKRKVQDVLSMDPNHYEGNVGWIRVLLHEGKYEEAIAHGRKLAAADKRPRSRAFLAYALARSGQEAEARKILRELESESASRYVDPFSLVLIHIALGEHDRAMTLLEKAVQDDAYAIRLKTEPLLDPLRNDPRFEVLLRRAGFSTQ